MMLRAQHGALEQPFLAMLLCLVILPAAPAPSSAYSTLIPTYSAPHLTIYSALHPPPRVLPTFIYSVSIPT